MICQAIKDSSAEVFNWISKQKEVGEESITDWSLYNANRLDGRIQYHQFNRHEEGKYTGADFELWILTNSIYFKARIQAKRLRPQKDLYSSIAHSNKYGLQIDKLITDASRGGFRPLYAFYNNENHTSKCQLNIKNEGIYLADAFKIQSDVFSVAKRNIDSSHLISLSLPFSCWFCCELYNPENHGTFEDFLKRYYSLTPNTKLSGFTNDLPNYVKESLRFSENQKNESKQNIEYDLQREFRILREVDGLLIIDNRKK
jgi:hypothetical protein